MPLWQQTAELLDAVPGVGALTVHTLLAELPEQRPPATKCLTVGLKVTAESSPQ